MLQQKKMFKVLCPIEKRDGGKWWMSCGSGFSNRDNSINVYLEALPVGQKEITLQLRELTEAELRERAEKRAAYAARSQQTPSAAPATGGFDNPPF